MILRRLIPLIGTLIILVAVSLQADIRHSLTVLAALPWLPLLGACGIALSEELLVGPYKWRLMVNAVGLRLSFSEALLIRLGSQPIRSVAPLKTGEAASVVYLCRVHHMDLATATSTSLFEKAVNVWAAVFLMTVGLTISGLYWVAVATVLLVALPFIRGPWNEVAAWLSQRGKAAAFVGRLLDAFLMLRPHQLALQLPLAVVFTGLEVFNSWWLFNVLGAPVPMAAVLVVVPLSYFLNNIPVTVMGIGMREGLFVMALSAWAPPHMLLAGGVAVSAVEYVVPTLVGLVALKPFLSRCAVPEDVG